MEWHHLKAYGYAPGGYMGRCHRCSKIVHDIDKRATSCLPCAEAAHAEAMAAGPEWTVIQTADELPAFYASRLPAIREVAREHGYAIGVHGSTRRDFDLIAAPWREGAADPDTLAHAIAQAACGIDRAGPYNWEKKPAGRVATSIPICWPEWCQPGAGHIDLSVMPSVVIQTAG